jgi:hypothetical protein
MATSPNEHQNGSHLAASKEGLRRPVNRVNAIERITPAEARDALLKSGYLLEHRLEAVLRRKGWYVEANTAYQDKETGKSRELDIYALTMRRLGKKPGFVWAVLLIECVNNSQPLAFITKKPSFAAFHSQEIKLAGLPAKVFVRPEKQWQSVPDFLDMEEHHHYCRGRLATQYCSFSRKKDTKRWMASHDDLHFDALRTLCTALEYKRDKFFGSWNFDSSAAEYVNLEFYYPVLVLQGELMEVVAARKSVDLKAATHLQYRRSSIWKGEEQDYQVDVVTEGFFPRYISIVEKELETTAQRMRCKRAVIQYSLEKIETAAKRLRSPEKIRAAMEYKWRGLLIQ